MAETEFKWLADEDTSLLKYLQTIWRRKTLVGLIALGTFAMAIVYSNLQQPLYQSLTTIQLGVHVYRPIIPGSEDAGASIASEVEILKSRVIAEKTVMRLERHYALESLPQGVRFELGDVEFGDGVQAGSYTVTLLDGAGRYELRNSGGERIGMGQLGQPFRAPGISLTLSSKDSPRTGMTFRVHLKNPATLSDRLRQKVEIEVLRSTNIVAVKIRDEDPQEAAVLANGVAESYVDFTREQKVQGLVTMRKFLEAQIEVFQKDLLKRGEKLAGSAIEGDPEGVFAQLRRGRMSGIEGSGGSVGEDVRYTLAKALLELELRRAALKSVYAPNHQLVVKLDEEIAELRERLKKQLQLEKKDIQLLDLLRESHVTLQLYNYMLQRRQETRIAEASEGGSARIIDRAISPKSPISPNIRRNAALGGAVGLFLGLGFVLFLNQLDRSVKDVKDLEDRAGLPVFGVIPEIPDWRGKSLDSLGWRQDSQGVAFLTGTHWQRAHAAEAYRALRTNLQFASPVASRRAFLFTSAGPMEGKTLTAANLAVTLSQLERRVLLVECDLRKPRLHELFGLERDTGLTEILTGKAARHDVAQPTKFKNLDLICCGPIPPNPAELLSGQAMAAFLREVSEQYDLVLIDTPPVLLFTDACVLAPLVSGVFLVVRAGVATRDAIARSRALLEAVNGRVVGAVLNALTQDGLVPYDYYAHYYQDGDTEERGYWDRMKRRARRLLSYIL